MSTPTIPPLAWFEDPQLPELTPLTVTDDGHVYGHVAGWSTNHVSFPGRQIKPPRSRSGYSYFHTGTLAVQDGDQVKEIPVGHLSMGGGHAGTELSQAATAAFYDDVSNVAADVRVGEDQHGIWFAGVLAADLDELRARRFRSCAVSGDWRHVDGMGLELTAVLSVISPGFPIPRARVASGAPLALVAAGALPPARRTVPFALRVADGWTRPGRIAELSASKLTTGTLAAAESFAKLIVDEMQQRQAVADHAALVAQLDDTQAVVAALLAEVDDTPTLTASLLAELDDTPQRFVAALAEVEASPKG